MRLLLTAAKYFFIITGLYTIGLGQIALAEQVETWAEYSMNQTRRAGQIWADGAPVSQFVWAPQGDTESHIYWGDPIKWPHQYHESFIQGDEWIMLDGWWDNGTYYSLRVIEETLCEATCNSTCTTIATSGPQHYTKRKIQTAAYCLKASGTITEQSTGKIIKFGHTQVYWPPTTCGNAYMSNHQCIRQWESWWDDNRTSYQRKLDRDVYLAKGIGPGFSIYQYFPSPWHAELRYYWDY